MTRDRAGPVKSKRFPARQETCVLLRMGDWTCRLLHVVSVRPDRPGPIISRRTALPQPADPEEEQTPLHCGRPPASRSKPHRPTYRIQWTIRSNPVGETARGSKYPGAFGCGQWCSATGAATVRDSHDSETARPDVACENDDFYEPTMKRFASARSEMQQRAPGGN